MKPRDPEPAVNPPTFYDAICGAATFTRIVDRFYAAVVDDPVLRPLYPDEDITEASRRLRMFLIQYWGGPATYNEERGHPRLRLRHAPFAIDGAARDAWIGHMTEAVVAERLPAELQTRLLDYLIRAAYSLQNA